RKSAEELRRAPRRLLAQHVPVPPAPAGPPGERPPPPPVRVPEADPRVLARVYGSLPVTREDLGEFLIARGGYEKLELLVNRKIIEVEAAKRNITVTAIEVEAGLADDLKGMGITKLDFVEKVLPRYHKTLYEWTEDGTKPRI